MSRLVVGEMYQGKLKGKDSIWETVQKQTKNMQRQIGRLASGNEIPRKALWQSSSHNKHKRPLEE